MKRYLTAKEFVESGKLDPHENFKITFITDPYYHHRSAAEEEKITNLCDLMAASSNYDFPVYKLYKNNIRKYRKFHAHVLTKDNRFIRFSYCTNKKTRGWVVDYVYEPTKDAKCFYFARLHNTDYIETSEVSLFEKLLRAYDDEDFLIYKMSLVCKYQYPIILPAMCDWEKETLDAVAYLKSLPKDDPDRYYWEYMKYTRCEQHAIERDGTVNSCCTASEVDIYSRGYMDFMNPITFDEIYNEENPLFWSREYSDLVDWEDDYGNIYEGEYYE